MATLERPAPYAPPASTPPAGRAAERACANCGTPAPLAYCPACGQAQHTLHRSLRSIVGELLDTFAGWDGKIPVTLWLLLLRPGRLTAEYLAGRRARFLPPLRLYLSLSVLLVLAFQQAKPRTGGFRVNLTGGSGVHTTRVAASSAPARGAPSGGAPSSGAPSSGAPSSGAPSSGAPSSGAPSSGAPSSGAPSSGAPSSGAPSSGAPSSGAPSSGAPSSGALDPSLTASGPWQKMKRSYFGGRITSLEHMSNAERNEALKAAFVAKLGNMFFALVPVFALLVAALYRRGPFVYAEHLVFALHVHAFAAAAFALVLLLPSGGWKVLPIVWLPAYLFVALRRVYGGSRRKTVLKFGLLGAGYFAALMVAMMVTAALAFLVG